jgi:hypothetical protein
MPDHGDEEAEALFQKAVEIARRQEAKSLEVRAATSVQYHRHSLGSVRQADGARSLSHRLRSTPAPGSRKGGTCPGLARIIHEAAGIGALRLSWGTADVVAHGVAAAGEPDPLVGPAWCSSSQPCEHSSGATPWICAANAAGGRSPSEECGLTSL